MVKFLLENKANPYITSTPEEGKEETVLETACRWNYPNIIKLYLQKFSWSKEILKKCLKLCRSENARNEIKRCVRGSLVDCICDCFCNNTE
jgi:ankyrin repeat protein